MNKSNVKQKRSLGKESPFSKRPKLDFAIKSKEPLKDNKYNSKESPKGCNGFVKEKVTNAPVRKNTQENTPEVSDWDEDFSGDMLEKVCLIADLSQAMVNNQPVPREFDNEKLDFEIFDNNKVTTKPKTPNTPSESSGNEYENLKAELNRLQEKLKTKEGEVHILRSQLKQNEDTKQAVALQNIKAIEEIKKKYNDKINLTEKELESTKGKLLFRDLEYKTLSERCRQLEYNISKSKLNEAASSKSISMSQISLQKCHTKENLENDESVVDGLKNSLVDYEFSNNAYDEGKHLANIICPEFFKSSQESNIVPFHNIYTDLRSQKTEVSLDRSKNFNCNDLPKQTVWIKDLNPLVSHLFTFNNFNQKEAQETLQSILNSCVDILTHVNQVLSFLEKLQLCSDYDKADQSLLQNEDEVKTVKIKNLIDGEKQSEDECGTEARRSLALIYALMKTSQFACNTVKDSVDFMELLKNLATAIGTLRRPLRYNGILIGITLILQKILEEATLTKEYLTIVSQTLEEIIFSRPKLDVLLEIVKVLSAGKHHLDFVISLCRKDSVDSCTLYMDCKLKQAMFFTKNTCPLKLLCMQIMGLACLPSSKPLRWEMTKCIINWLNSLINTPFHKKIKWLPVNLDLREERCFNVTECLLYLLINCLKDYLEDSLRESVTSEKSEIEKNKIEWISIIAEGSVLLKRILKADQRYLHENTYSLRFAMLLTAFLADKSDLGQKTHMYYMSSLQMEAITWITDLLESSLRNQDFSLKQNTSVISETDFFNTLKINDEPKIN